MSTTLARVLSVAVATLIACTAGTGAVGAGTTWEGQFNPKALLDNSQVERRDLAPGLDTAADQEDTDCWDEWSCLRTENDLSPEYIEVVWWDEAANGPWLDDDYQPHYDCSLVIADTTLIACPDGYTETS